VLPEFAGVAVHDAWAPYDTYEALTHALCNAHVLRELQAVTDTTPEGRWCWAQQTADALREMNQLVKDALAASSNLDGIDAVALAAAIHRYRSAALLGVEATRARVTKLMAKQHALARRLIDRQDDYLRFTTDPRVRSIIMPMFGLCRWWRECAGEARGGAWKFGITWCAG
jgi:transposase